MMKRETLREAILSRMTYPAIGKCVINVQERGILPDTGENAGAFIQAVIDEVSSCGGGKVIFPAGVYLSGALAMRTCTSVAPASRSILTILSDVVPRTMESSTITTLLPLTIDLTGESFIFTPFSRRDWVGRMNVRPTYLLLIKPISYGRPLASA